jgi:hypothetical protein
MVNDISEVLKIYVLDFWRSKYFNTNHLLKQNYMYICRALLKHGYPNFSLTILEYCEPSKYLEREDYYFQLLKPEYNTAKKPGSPMSGRTHSDESKKRISETKKAKNNPMYGKPKAEGSGRPSQAIEVVDLLEKTTTSYDYMHEAARAFFLPRHNIISNYILRNQQKPYKGRYTFHKIS